MKRFTGDPQKMSSYITNDMKEIIQRNIPSKKFGFINLNVRVPILTIGIHIMRIKIILGIIGTE